MSLLCLQMNAVNGTAGEEVVLEYHHPEPSPPAGTFIARIASVLQVSAPEMSWQFAAALSCHLEDDIHV